jgi:hypothetical protein
VRDHDIRVNQQFLTDGSFRPKAIRPLNFNLRHFLLFPDIFASRINEMLAERSRRCADQTKLMKGCSYRQARKDNKEHHKK